MTDRDKLRLIEETVRIDYSLLQTFERRELNKDIYMIIASNIGAEVVIIEIGKEKGQEDNLYFLIKPNHGNIWEGHDRFLAKGSIMWIQSNSTIGRLTLQLFSQKE